MAMKQHFNADSHALALVVVPINGFYLASFMDIAIFASGTSYSSHWYGPGAFYCYSAGVSSILQCIIAVYYMHTLLGAILLIKMDR